MATATLLNLLAATVFIQFDGRAGAAVNDDRLEVILLAPSRRARAVRQESESAPQRPVKRRSIAPALQGTTPAVLGPPTETVAHVSLTQQPTNEPTTLDVTALAERCSNLAPPASGEVEAPIALTLRVFVMPDGRIAQGQIDQSSGDTEFDRQAFICLQTYANLTPAIEEGNPVGSWQTIETRWLR